MGKQLQRRLDKAIRDTEKQTREIGAAVGRIPTRPPDVNDLRKRLARLERLLLKLLERPIRRRTKKKP